MKSLNKTTSNNLIIVYTIIALFILLFIEIESSGSVPINSFFISYNKTLILLDVTVFFNILIGLKKLNVLRFNTVFTLLLIKCIYDLNTVILGKIIADQEFWYHYSMILLMPFVYIIYLNYTGSIKLLFTIFSIFAIILVSQEIYTAIINNFAFSSDEYKQFFRLPIAHSNIIAVILLSILVPRILICIHSMKNLFVNTLIIIGIVLTQSRGALIFLICWILIIRYLIKYKKITGKVVFKVLLVLFMLVLTICLIPQIQLLLFNAIINDADFLSIATSGRSDLLSLSFITFLENPLFGVGLGVIEYDLGYEIIQTGVHNIILDYLVQCGIFGTIIYASAIIFVFKYKPVLNSKYSFGIFLSIISMLLYSMVEVCYFNTSCLYLFWTLCGLYNSKYAL